MLLSELVLVLTQLYAIVILARVLMSWVQIDPYSPLARTLYNLTEPVLAPLRNLMPPAGGFDFSPIIALIGIQFLGAILAEFLRQAGL